MKLTTILDTAGAMSTVEICHVIATIAVVLMTTSLVYLAYKADVRSRIEHHFRMDSMTDMRAQQRAMRTAIADLAIDTGCPVCGNNGCPECGEPDRRYLFAPPPVN